MSNTELSEPFYLSYVSLLMHGKLQLISIGAEFDLTLIQTLTLLVLANAGQVSMSRLGKLYACDASNVTGIVDGLEQKKLVARTTHPDDRRIKMICLEPAGKKMQTKLLKRLAETDNYLFSNLSSAEKKQFAHLIHKAAPDLREEAA